MITRIEIDGFKSFRKFSLDLEPLTVILGPNSAGKSNLFDALHLLSLLPYDSLPAIMGRGRGRILDQFARLNDGLSRRMSFAVELLLPSSIRDLTGRWPAWEVPATRVRYELDIDRSSTSTGREEVRIAREQITPLPADDPWAARHPELAALCRYARPDDKGREDGLAKEMNSYSPVLHFDGPRSLLGLPMFDTSTPVRVAGAVARQLGAMRFLHMDAVKLRQPSERAAVESLTWEPR